jgi:hypothetical protein
VALLFQLNRKPSGVFSSSTVAYASTRKDDLERGCRRARAGLPAVTTGRGNAAHAFCSPQKGCR